MKRTAAFLLLLVLFLNKVTAQTTSNKSLPNILLIVVDDLGYADFGPFENHDTSVVSPNITNLGKSGVIFTDAYTTAPVCSPSRAGILTGKNQFRWDTRSSWGPGLPRRVKTIPEYLQDVGYVTARIGKNDLGRNFHKYDVREYPLEHGYDTFLGFSAHAHDYWLLSEHIEQKTPDPKNTSALLGPLMHNKSVKSYEEGYLTDILTDEAIQYFQDSKNKPFFLTLAYNSVHHLIHEVPKKYLDKFNVKPIQNYSPDHLMAFGKHKAGTYSAYYDKYSRTGAISATDMRNYYLANLNCLDDNIGRVLTALKNEDLEKNTIVIFISDNGGSPLTGANNSPLTAGKYSLWEGGIRVLMAMRWPEKILPGKVETNPVSATDILPTLAHAAGITLKDKTLDGIDLIHPLKERLLVWKWQKTWAVRKGDWKLTNTHENHWKGDPTQLYIKPIIDNNDLKLFNLKNDFGERIDLSKHFPDKVKALELDYQNWCEANIGNY